MPTARVAVTASIVLADATTAVQPALPAYHMRERIHYRRRLIPREAGVEQISQATRFVVGVSAVGFILR